MNDERRPAVLHYHRPGPKEPAWYVVACRDWAGRHHRLCTLVASALAAVPLAIALVLVYFIVSGAVK